MCGRYAASRNPDDLVEEFEVVARPEESLEPDYNVAPTKNVYAVIERAPREDKQAPPRRELAVVRWGLVPSWAKDASIGSRMINARMETVAEKPAYRKAFARRRCLLPADGYYEWYTPENGPKGKNGKPLKQPFFIHPADGGVLAMAGLYELWRDPTKADDDPDRWLMTTTVLTTTAEDAVGMIHDRMPMMVERDRWAQWLDPSVDGSTSDLASLLVPAAPGRLDAYPVSTAVNAVRNNGPELVEPIAAEPDDALF
jgi:putative SOS response-associated peptidase YedK